MPLNSKTIMISVHRAIIENNRELIHYTCTVLYNSRKRVIPKSTFKYIQKMFYEMNTSEFTVHHYSKGQVNGGKSGDALDSYAT